MPVRSNKQEIEDFAIVRFRKQAIEDRYSALGQQVTNPSVSGRDGDHTCRRFSKSRAASFFISEEFEENFRIVSLPKAGTSL